MILGAVLLILSVILPFVVMWATLGFIRWLVTGRRWLTLDEKRAEGLREWLEEVCG